MNVVPLPGMLEKRLADLGSDRAALARALVAEGWHPKNVERVLGTQVLADGGSTSYPEGAERKRSAGAATPAAHAPAPRRGGSTAPSPRLAVAAPPRETPAPIAQRDAKPDNVVHLPVWERPRMFPGEGVRHDCVHENECLSRAVQAEPRIRAVHCPTWCKHLEAPSFEARLGLDGGRAEGNFR